MAVTLRRPKLSEILNDKESKSFFYLGLPITVLSLMLLIGISISLPTLQKQDDYCRSMDGAIQRWHDKNFDKQCNDINNQVQNLILLIPPFYLLCLVGFCNLIYAILPHAVITKKARPKIHFIDMLPMNIMFIVMIITLGFFIGNFSSINNNITIFLFSISFSMELVVLVFFLFWSWVKTRQRWRIKYNLDPSLLKSFWDIKSMLIIIPLIIGNSIFLFIHSTELAIIWQVCILLLVLLVSIIFKKDLDRKYGMLWEPPTNKKQYIDLATDMNEPTYAVEEIEPADIIMKM